MRWSYFTGSFVPEKLYFNFPIDSVIADIFSVHSIDDVAVKYDNTKNSRLTDVQKKTQLPNLGHSFKFAR